MAARAQAIDMTRPQEGQQLMPIDSLEDVDLNRRVHANQERLAPAHLTGSYDFIVCRAGASGSVAGSRWYRTAQLLEISQWLRGRHAHRRIDVPVRMLHGARHPVITSTLLRGYADRMRDFEIETVDDAGHWIVE
jgi:pimeloyl-ACP methyl ester carboxylesterase